MHHRNLSSAFAAWAAADVPLVLATVYETVGSTYSKFGAQMLIAADGSFHGMLSGGCLEGDLATRALSVIETGQPQCVTYDLGADDDELWGLGVGCDGTMKIFLQCINSATNYEPFRSMTEARNGRATQSAITVLTSGVESVAPGQSLVTNNDQIVYDTIAAPVRELLDEWIRGDHVGLRTFGATTGQAVLLKAELPPPPSILVLGAGLDAEPVIRLMAELGWRVTLQDHRPAYLAAGDFSHAESTHCLPAAEIDAAFDLETYAAAIVMSHHLPSDRAYLSQLAGSPIEYIGLLGPEHRRRRLLDGLPEVSKQLQPRLRGPVGLDLGGSGPASIALSIVAEIHATLHGKEI